MTLNRNQIMAIAIAVLSVLAVSTSQLTDLFGAGIAKTIISAAGLLNTILSSVLAVISSQSGIIQSASDMPGVESIHVNARANQTLAAMAMDPTQDKVAPTSKDAAAVSEIAKQGT